MQSFVYSNSVSTTSIYLNSFGINEICVQTSINSTYIQSCIFINVIPRTIEGGIISPMNNSNTTNKNFNLEFWARN